MAARALKSNLEKARLSRLDMLTNKLWVYCSICAFLLFSSWRLGLSKITGQSLWSITLVSESRIAPEMFEESTLEASIDYLNQASAHSNNLGTATDGNQILLVNAWIGSAMPSYFPLFLERIRLNPATSFLLISSRDTPEFCPADGSVSIYFPSNNPNIRVHCSETAIIVAKSARALCSEWSCSTTELQKVTTNFQDYINIDGQAWNNLKPLYATIFRKQIYSMFPHRSFSHWIRIDLDVFLGDFDGLFPQYLREFDIFTFFPSGSMNWCFIYLKGYLTGHRLSQQVDKLWLTMSMFKNPDSFLQAFHAQTFSNVTRSLAVDEGTQTVNTIRDHPEISFIVEPDLLMVDLDIAANRNRKVVLHGNDSNIFNLLVNGDTDSHVAYSEDLRIPALPASRSVLYLGNVELSQNCDMPWLENQDRLCAKAPRGSRVRQLQNTGSQIRITRQPGLTQIRAYKLDARESLDGSPVMAYHAQVSKKDGLVYDRVPYGSRLEVSKDEDSYWRMSTIDEFGRRTRLQRSTHYWPGVWE